ncbi:MAG: hypothetical protein R2684_04590 [Pyrinomonadaceae bacterium]
MESLTEEEKARLKSDGVLRGTHHMVDPDVVPACEDREEISWFITEVLGGRFGVRTQEIGRKHADKIVKLLDKSWHGATFFDGAGYEEKYSFLGNGVLPDHAAVDLQIIVIRKEGIGPDLFWQIRDSNLPKLSEYLETLELNPKEDHERMTRFFADLQLFYFTKDAKYKRSALAFANSTSVVAYDLENKELSLRKSIRTIVRKLDNRQEIGSEDMYPLEILCSKVCRYLQPPIFPIPD